MKVKTKIKIFLAVLIGIIAIICQECVRRHFNINPQIWVFVVYAMSLAGFYLTIYAFCKELDEMKLMERMEKSKFIRFCTEEYSVEEEQSRFKGVIKKVLESRIYEEIDFLTSFFLCSVAIYALFFLECFWPSNFIVIVCLLNAWKCFTNTIVVVKKQRLHYGVQTFIQLLIAVGNISLQ